MTHETGLSMTTVAHIALKLYKTARKLLIGVAILAVGIAILLCLIDVQTRSTKANAADYCQSKYGADSHAARAIAVGNDVKHVAIPDNDYVCILRN